MQIRHGFDGLVMLSVACLGGVTSLCAQNPSDTKVSTYAPVKDAEAQLKYYLGRLEKDLGDEESYDEDHHSRVALDASTVAVLALSLGRHDEETKYRKPAAQLIRLAVELADCSDDFDAAKEKLAEFKAAATSGDKAEETTWEPSAELVYLMKQVPNVNAPLRQGVWNRRFARSLDRTAGHAVTLAVIAQASMLDTTYCGDEEDEMEWQRICAELRDASAQVYKALRAKDQEKAKDGADRIAKTCDACHHRFRD